MTNIALIFSTDLDAETAVEHAHGIFHHSQLDPGETVTVLGPVENDGESYVSPMETEQEYMMAMRHLAQECVAKGLTDHNTVIGDVANWQVEGEDYTDMRHGAWDQYED